VASHTIRVGTARAGAGDVAAVVVGAAGACGLGLLRSLGAARVPVVLMDTDRSAPAMYSRYGRKILIQALQGPPLIRELLALRAGMRASPVLFVTDDEAALTVSLYRNELQGRFRFRLPSHECLTALMHKTRFQELAEHHGFAVPRSVRIAHQDDLQALAELRFPCIVKPALRTAQYVSCGLQRAYKVESDLRARTIAQRLLSVVPELIVQEWITGPDNNIYFCLQYRCEALGTICCFTGRKLSIWPPDVGITASCTAAPHVESELQALTESFFERTAFVGVGSIEYKQDARTGAFVMVEPTVGRVDWQEEVATLHGVNIPLEVYRYETGLARTPSMRQGSPVVWRDAWAHWRSNRHDHSPRDAIPPAKVYDAYWRVDDPVPGLVRGLGGSMKLLRGVLSRARSPRFRRTTRTHEQRDKLSS
jgi:D-aspartate ligase